MEKNTDRCRSTWVEMVYLHRKVFQAVGKRPFQRAIGHIRLAEHTRQAVDDRKGWFELWGSMWEEEHGTSKS